MSCLRRARRVRPTHRLTSSRARARSSTSALPSSSTATRTCSRSSRSRPHSRWPRIRHGPGPWTTRRVRRRLVDGQLALVVESSQEDMLSARMASLDLLLVSRHSSPTSAASSTPTSPIGFYHHRHPPVYPCGLRPVIARLRGRSSSCREDSQAGRYALRISLPVR